MNNIYYKKYIKYKEKYITEKNKLKTKNNLLTGGYDFENEYNLGYRNYTLTENDQKSFKGKNYFAAGTFGTLSKEGLNDLFIKSKQYVNNLNNKNFLDIGSGDGRLVFWAKDYGFNNSFGIELSESRHNLSLQELNKLGDNDKKKLFFINKDIMDVNLINKDIDIIYISSLCMPDKLIADITQKLSKETKKGTLIFSSSPLLKTLNPKTPIVKDNNLEYIDDINVKQSWADDSNVNIYRTY
jgi:SAM-dependent methyltransferase